MNDIEQTRAMWDAVAADWQVQVGEHGDANRQLNSDPVLWQFLGDVAGQRILDAGCGTGYLTRQLAAKGATVTGVDLSEQMIEIAQSQQKHQQKRQQKQEQNAPPITFAVDSCQILATQGDATFDRVVSNYVLMDLPDLDAAMQSFARVLKPGGEAVLIFSHPCFPGGRAETDRKGKGTRYLWHHPYFLEQKNVDPAWGHFDHEFIWFHRPLRRYWQAFKAAGFLMVDFEEPHVDAAVAAEKLDAASYERALSRPYSVAFLLRKSEIS